MASASCLLLHFLLWVEGHMQEINLTFKWLVYKCDTAMEEVAVLTVDLCVSALGLIIRQFYLLPIYLLLFNCTHALF